MAAAQGDPPAVARQRVRRSLRRFRDATSLSQGDVAKQLGWSLSKMQRLESGEVGVSETDLRALLVLYGVQDRAVVDRLVEEARLSRRQRYLTAPEHREHLPSGLLQLIQFEQRAVAIRAYQATAYPGVLQTPAVAEALLAWWGESVDDEARRVLFDVRMTRRRHLVDNDNGPEYFLILDESVIRRRVKNVKVTAEQLADIVEVAQRSNVHIRMVPFTHGVYMPSLGPFQILDLGVSDDDSVLYREIYLRDEVVHDDEEIRFYRSAFERLWARSLSEQATLRVIAAQADLLRSAADFEEAD
jgi:transcriptional regulator with XRE-family HTH domain